MTRLAEILAAADALTWPVLAIGIIASLGYLAGKLAALIEAIRKPFG